MPVKPNHNTLHRQQNRPSEFQPGKNLYPCIGFLVLTATHVIMFANIGGVIDNHWKTSKITDI